MTEDDKANELIQKAVQHEFINAVLHALPVAFELVKYNLLNKRNDWMTSADLVITSVDVVEEAFHLVDEMTAQYVERLREETSP